MKWLDMRNPFSPKAAEKIPSTIKIMFTDARAMDFI